MRSGLMNLSGIPAAARALGIKATPPFAIGTEKVVAWAGVFLLLIVATLANQAYKPQRTRTDRVRGWIARRGIDLAALVGWLADRLPSPTTAPPPVMPTGTPTSLPTSI